MKLTSDWIHTVIHVKKNFQVTCNRVTEQENLRMDKKVHFFKLHELRKGFSRVGSLQELTC